MNIKGTYPGALLAFPDTEVVTSRSTVEIDETNVADVNYDGVASWAMGPGIVLASFGYDDDEYFHLLYTLTHSSLGWVKVNRKKKVVDHVA